MGIFIANKSQLRKISLSLFLRREIYEGKVKHSESVRIVRFQKYVYKQTTYGNAEEKNECKRKETRREARGRKKGERNVFVSPLNMDCRSRSTLRKIYGHS